ncbi:hypothetical protein [Myxacorys almedinensis]|uniref:Uncharacterized protein n=1 Tax=Myxacorys almedinensis A TaxID=2690445 RepID=A0A8J7Z209_9CYAN|nr:hypothetical protein [Myxacorys almedinensis]NDJ18912.1 hypothetical protein [Myxacorys almedinensis A]
MSQQENNINSDAIVAHNVKTAGNVAAIFHIEPNHNPKAGKPSQAWFALTKQGGEILPLDHCNCTLKVYDRQRNLVLQPSLQPISAEQYQGIPGADLVFPHAGIYTLELSGTPNARDRFNAFTLTYDVTVQAGTAAQFASPSVGGAAEPPRSPEPNLLASWGVSGAAIALLLVGVFWFIKRK